MYQILTKSTPIRVKSIYELRARLKENKPICLPYPQHVGSCLKTICNGLLEKNPQKRYTIKQSLEYLKKENDFVVVSKSKPKCVDLENSLTKCQIMVWAANRILDKEKKKSLLQLALLCAENDSKTYNSPELDSLIKKLKNEIGNDVFDKDLALEMLNMYLLDHLQYSIDETLKNGQDAVSDELSNIYYLVASSANHSPENEDCSNILGTNSYSSIVPRLKKISQPISIPKSSSRVQKIQAQFCYSCGGRFLHDRETCVCGSPRHTL
jgi:serine/threonine protein kinase